MDRAAPYAKSFKRVGALEAGALCRGRQRPLLLFYTPQMQMDTKTEWRMLDFPSIRHPS
jgi:hypothetical protein